VSNGRASTILHIDLVNNPLASHRDTRARGRDTGQRALRPRARLGHLRAARSLSTTSPRARLSTRRSGSGIEQVARAKGGVIRRPLSQWRWRRAAANFATRPVRSWAEAARVRQGWTTGTVCADTDQCSSDRGRRGASRCRVSGRAYRCPCALPSTRFHRAGRGPLFSSHQSGAIG